MRSNLQKPKSYYYHQLGIASRHSVHPKTSGFHRASFSTNTLSIILPRYIGLPPPPKSLQKASKVKRHCQRYNTGQRHLISFKGKTSYCRPDSKRSCYNYALSNSKFYRKSEQILLSSIPAMMRLYTTIVFVFLVVFYIYQRILQNLNIIEDLPGVNYDGNKRMITFTAERLSDGISRQHTSIFY